MTYEYPALRVQVTVCDHHGLLVTTYSFWLDDDTARKAFAARCTDAWLAGQTVTTKQAAPPRRQ